MDKQHVDKPSSHKDVIKNIDESRVIPPVLRHHIPNDPIVFAVKGQYYYQGSKIEDLTKDELLAVLRKVLQKQVFK